MTEISILDAIGVPAMYEQLAEEAGELAHAPEDGADSARRESYTGDGRGSKEKSGRRVYRHHAERD